MAVRWKDKTDIATLADGDRIPVTDVDDANTDKYTTPAEIKAYVEANGVTLPNTGLRLLDIGALSDRKEYLSGPTGPIGSLPGPVGKSERSESPLETLRVNANAVITRLFLLFRFRQSADKSASCQSRLSAKRWRARSR